MKIEASALLAVTFLLSAVAYGQRDPDYDKVVVLQTRIDARRIGRDAKCKLSCFV